jgi:hypothetical protein
MPRLSIDISAEEHQKLKAIAALKGQTIKDYVLGRALDGFPPLDDTMSESEALDALKGFLEPRLAQARNGEFSSKSFKEIRETARDQTKA